MTVPLFYFFFSPMKEKSFSKGEKDSYKRKHFYFSFLTDVLVLNDVES